MKYWHVSEIKEKALATKSMNIKIKALVPMKGHSERIPNKNVRNFCGKPLFYRIFDTLLKVNYIDAIVVNTDCKTIKELIKKNYRSIMIIDRPFNLKGDCVSMNRIINYDISKIEGEHFLQTHSTNPLLKISTVERAIKKYFSILKDGYDSLLGVSKYQERFYDSYFRLINHKYGELIRTQDLPPIYKENSCIYLFSRDSFIGNNNNRIGKKPYFFEINKIESMDIDDKEDFFISEVIYKVLNNPKRENICKKK